VVNDIFESKEKPITIASICIEELWYKKNIALKPRLGQLSTVEKGRSTATKILVIESVTSNPASMMAIRDRATG
jgi:hypothetical protein